MPGVETDFQEPIVGWTVSQRTGGPSIPVFSPSYRIGCPIHVVRAADDMNGRPQCSARLMMVSLSRFQRA